MRRRAGTHRSRREAIPPTGGESGLKRLVGCQAGRVPAGGFGWPAWA